MLEQFEELKKIAKNKFKIKKKKIKKLSISYELTSIKTLGYYTRKERTIYLNRAVMEQNPKKFKSVLIHEFAHFIQKELFPNSTSHGKEWKDIMKILGETNPRARATNFNKELYKAYPDKIRMIKCDCTKHYVSRIKALNIINKKSVCVYCGSRFKEKLLSVSN